MKKIPTPSAAPAQDHSMNGGQNSKSPPGFELHAFGPKSQNLLDQEDLKEARGFYIKYQKDFSPEIKKEIQQRVGVAATGQITDSMLQAIAREQKKLGQRADGQLGPHSLPALFPHGLGEKKNQQTLVKQYLGTDLSKLKDSKSKAQKMVDLVNKQVWAKGKVPPVAFSEGPEDGNAGSFFDTAWEMDVNLKFLMDGPPGTDRLDDMMSVIVHEMRHAEQAYNVAQWMVGQGHDVHSIQKKMDIPLKVIAYALNDPIKPNSAKGLIAKHWYESFYGKDKMKTEKVYGAKKMNMKKYHALPMENDAHRVTDEYDAELARQRGNP